mmetsp:Transcript_29834/g.70319  ORF Transcript_29834/g.70319 Transcript_29834/m.70319 type:complete len:80 (+) Transcript_29834:84-323(+)
MLRQILKPFDDILKLIVGAGSIAGLSCHTPQDRQQVLEICPTCHSSTHPIDSALQDFVEFFSDCTSDENETQQNMTQSE